MPDRDHWRCIYCGEPIAEAERKAAVKALCMSARRIGRAHPACKAKAIAAGGRGIWGTGESWRSKAVK